VVIVMLRIYVWVVTVEECSLWQGLEWLTGVALNFFILYMD